jgi:hypothetical protein
MRIIGVDLHTRQETIAMLDTETGELVEKVLMHEGSDVRNFYSTLPGAVRVGIEATGSMQWFVNLMEELGIECQVGHPAKIRAAEPRRQKHDRRDADLILKLHCEQRLLYYPGRWRRRRAPPQARPCRTRGRSCSLASCFLLLVLARSGRAAEIRDGDIYRESSHIQLTSHVFPPSDEKDCSIRDDLGEMSSQT